MATHPGHPTDLHGHPMTQNMLTPGPAPRVEDARGRGYASTPARAPHELQEHFLELVAAVEEYAIFLLGPGGEVLSWNAGAERIKGYRAGEILGRPFSVFYPPEAVASGWPDHELRVA